MESLSVFRGDVVGECGLLVFLVFIECSKPSSAPFPWAIGSYWNLDFFFVGEGSVGWCCSWCCDAKAAEDRNSELRVFLRSAFP